MGSCMNCGQGEGTYGGVCPSCIKYSVEHLPMYHSMKLMDGNPSSNDFQNSASLADLLKKVDSSADLFTSNSTSKRYNFNSAKYDITKTRNGIDTASLNKKNSIDALFRYNIKDATSAVTSTSNSKNNYVFSVYKTPVIGYSKNGKAIYGITLVNGYALKPTALGKGNYSIVTGKYAGFSNNTSYSGNSSKPSYSASSTKGGSTGSSSGSSSSK